MFQPRNRVAHLAALLALVSHCPRAELCAQQAPAVQELRTQRAAGATYFHVRLAPPSDLEAAPIQIGSALALQQWSLARQPRLVPQDKQTWAVYQRLEIRHFLPAVQLQSMPRSSLPASPLEFVGKWSGKGQARFFSSIRVARQHPLRLQHFRQRPPRRP
jgi:hypothetical protein